MPTYEYICDKCGLEFEAFQSMAEDPFKVCPKDKCKKRTWGKGKVHRQISAGAGLIFKGSGFYITDYRSENYKQAAKKESESGKSDSKKETSDSKPKGTESTAKAGKKASAKK